MFSFSDLSTGRRLHGKNPKGDALGRVVRVNIEDSGLSGKALVLEGLLLGMRPLDTPECRKLKVSKILWDFFFGTGDLRAHDFPEGCRRLNPNMTT